MFKYSKLMSQISSPHWWKDTPSAIYVRVKQKTNKTAQTLLEQFGPTAIRICIIKIECWFSQHTSDLNLISKQQV